MCHDESEFSLGTNGLGYCAGLGATGRTGFELGFGYGGIVLSVGFGAGGFGANGFGMNGLGFLPIPKLIGLAGSMPDLFGVIGGGGSDGGGVSFCLGIHGCRAFEVGFGG